MNNLKQLFFSPLERFGLSQKLQWLGLWSLLESFSAPFYSLLLIPIITINLGLKDYGFYIVIIALANFLSFTSLGMSTSLTYFLASNKEDPDRQKIYEFLGTALVITLIGSSFLQFLFLYFININRDYLYNIDYLFNAEYPFNGFIILLVVVTQLDTVASAALKGLHKFKISSKIEFSLRTTNFFLVAALAYYTKNLNFILLATLAMNLMNFLTRLKTLNHIHKFKMNYFKLNIDSAIKLLNYGKWMSLQNISSATFNSLDKIFLGYYFGSGVVGIYNIIVSITQITHLILAGTFSFSLAKITANKNNKKIILKIYYKLLSASVAFVLIISSLLIFIYPSIEKHFNLNGLDLAYKWLTISYAILAITVLPYYVLLGLGEVRILSIVNTLSTTVVIVLIIIFIKENQIYGAVSARVFYSFIGMSTLILVHKKLKS